MSKSVYEMMTEIDKGNFKISEHHKRILDEQYEFERDTIKPLREIIYEINKKIVSMKNTPIFARLEDIVNNYANNLNIQPSEVKVDYVTGFNSITHSHFYADFDIKNFNSHKDTSTNELDLYITISTSNTKPIHIKSTVNLNDKQKDGRPLGQHVLAYKKQEQNKFIVDVQIDNINDLTLNFILDNLIIQTHQGMKARDIISESILQASEKYNENIEEKTNI